jgi:hypothetical protein
LGAARSAGSAGHHRLVGVDRLEVVLGNRIFIFLAEKTLFNEHVDGRRRRIRKFALEQPNRPGVLVTAEDQLFFFLAGGHMRPHRQQRAHQHGHDAHADQQRCHRIAAVAPAVSAAARLTR